MKSFSQVSSASSSTLKAQPLENTSTVATSSNNTTNLSIAQSGDGVGDGDGAGAGGAGGREASLFTMFHKSGGPSFLATPPLARLDSDDRTSQAEDANVASPTIEGRNTTPTNPSGVYSVEEEILKNRLEKERKEIENAERLRVEQEKMKRSVILTFNDFVFENDHSSRASATATPSPPPSTTTGVLKAGERTYVEQQLTDHSGGSARPSRVRTARRFCKTQRRRSFVFRRATL
ncbi:hypothetical protein STCU_11452 [Strigomonas culicis]|uniref:Uncharacterized protein n=1 Tax=Strigomonas culicis TaxID=28005 RepID=S9V0E4_9TRYP|nr:hypothetical protein STCU_11452 [Strigomonas culicis]|eukprot:EPY16250.1 hypothetical protein STCU_11452 [Strigomonas culicis]